MRQIAFIGGFDKFDLILYTAIIINNQSKAKCLIVDSTIQEKSRYIVPTMENINYIKEKYVTTFQGIDVAVGFKTKDELTSYGILNNEMMEDGSTKENYDYIFLDIDEAKTLDSFNMGEKDLIFLTTAFDLYSLNKAFSVLDNTNCKLPVQKILFGKKITNSHITYMETVTGNRNINWGKYNIEFPYENGDWSIIQENQRENRLSISKFSSKFKSGLSALVRLISDENFFEVAKTVYKMQKDEKR